LGAVISPASINNFYSNVILKNGNTVPIGVGGVSFLKNLTIPIAYLDSFRNGDTSYDPSRPDGVNISYTTITKNSSKGTRQITSVVTDFWTALGSIKNETFLENISQGFDLNGKNNILIGYASNGNFNLGGIGEDGKEQVTRVYENGYYLKINDKFETLSASKALIFSNSTNRIPLIPSYVVSTITNGDDFYIEKSNLPLPDVIKILNGGEYEGDLFGSIWPLIYK
jgi:hypothetical protein